jgi:hypothetical protein
MNKIRVQMTFDHSKPNVIVSYSYFALLLNTLKFVHAQCPSECMNLKTKKLRYSVYSFAQGKTLFWCNCLLLQEHYAVISLLSYLKDISCFGGESGLFS